MNDRKEPAKYRRGGRTLQAEETASPKALRVVQHGMSQEHIEGRCDWSTVGEEYELNEFPEAGWSELK